MTFSWTQAKADAIKIKIRRNKTLARTQNPDFKLKHPDESRDANTGNYTKLIIRVKKETETVQALALTRREKLHGQN